MNKWEMRDAEWLSTGTRDVQKALSNNQLTYEQAKVVLDKVGENLIIQQGRLKVKP